MDPEPNNMKNAQDRFIETIRFLEARAQEVNYFQNYVKNKGSNPKKLVIQKLPKHMRRRAMSHNRYRIPSRVRKIAKEGFTKSLNTPRKFIPRKTARKFLFKSRTDLLTYYEYNITKPERILEHHQYLAKRMHMQTYMNIKIAWSSHVKCFKTAYKFSYNNCTIVDKSYYIYIEIKDNKHKINSINDYLEDFDSFCIITSRENTHIKMLMDPKLVRDFKHIIETKFDILIMHKNNYIETGRFLCTETFGTATIYYNIFNCFELTGGQTLSIIKRFISKYNDDTSLPFFSKNFSLLSFPKHYKESFNLSYNNQKIISTPFKKEIEDNNDILNQKISEFYEFLTTYRSDNSHFEHLITSTNNILQTLNALNNENKIDTVIETVNSDDKELTHNNIDKKKRYNITDIYANDPLPILIINISVNKLSRLVLVSPPATGSFILSNIQKSGALLIGKKEHEFVLKQHGLKLFPKDFPFTYAFKEFWSQKADKCEQTYLNRNIKFNYIINNCPLPFYGYVSKQIQVQSFLNVNALYSFFTICKGSIKKAALLFEPTLEDLSCLAKVFSTKEDFFTKILDKQDLLNFNLKEEEVNCDAMEFDNIIEYRTMIENVCKPMRKVVGQVLHSHFNYQIHKPKGVLFADKKKLDLLKDGQRIILAKLNNLKLLGDNEVLLLARNTEGFKYFFIKANSL